MYMESARALACLELKEFLMRTTRIVLFLAVMISITVTPAWAQFPVSGTIGLYLDDSDGNDLSRSGVVKKGKPFEIVVTMTTPEERHASLAVFQITELNLTYPGVFKVSTWKYNNTQMDLGRNDIGEYVFAFQECAPDGEIEILRVGYNHVSGPFRDVALYVGGLPEDTEARPTWDGAPGYITCADDAWSLDPEPWTDDSFDPTTIEGVTDTDGLLVLNPTHLVPIGTTSVSLLKSRF